MGKPLISQRRGKGSISFRAPSHRFKVDLKYRDYDDKTMRAEIVNFIDDPGRTAILALAQYEDGERRALLAPEGMVIGQIIEDGPSAKAEIGNVMPLMQIPEGFPVFNIERSPGDGGALVRSSGACAFIISKDKKTATIKLPSGKTTRVNLKCRATIGCASGGGRLEKPLLKAGKGHFKNKARGHWYPTVRGVHMNPVDHPFGGKQHHGAKTKKGKGGAPGQHVGSFGAKRTGRKKR
ncbi:50S ribosomal protein L2 [Candidatus Micrarchaeota archaeon]|nr:MAG: 50S ribosomal protein L2 [Candidatus Micrarchaeota archaeon]